jgi:hypothetical protein
METNRIYEYPDKTANEKRKKVTVLWDVAPCSVIEID